MSNIASNKTWTLETLDTQVAIVLLDGRPAICALANRTAAWNWTTQPSYIPLPEHVKIKGIDHSPNWIFREAVTDTGQGMRLELRFACQEPALELKSAWWACHEAGPVEHHITVKNMTEGDITVFNLPTFDISIQPLRDEALFLWRLHKDSSYADKTGTYVNPLVDGASYFANTNIDCSYSQDDSGFIPFVFVHSSGCHGIYMAYEAPKAMIRAAASGASPVTARITAGMFDDFLTDIPPGSIYDLPPAYLGTYNGDTDNGGNVFKRWFAKYKIPDTSRNDPDEPLAGYTPPCCYFDQKTQLQRESQVILEDYLNDSEYPVASWGVQSVTVDSGWWVITRNPPVINHEGDWRADPVDWPRSYPAEPDNPVKHTSDLIHRKGIKSFTLYFLFHDAKSEHPGALTSIGPNAHPEWFGKPGRIYWSGLKGDLADLGDPSCVDFIKTRLLQCFNDYDIQTLRSDYMPIPADSDKVNQHRYGEKDTVFWAAKGFYEIIDFMYMNRKGFRYESCSGGGSMKDFATLRHAVVMYATDYYGAHIIRKVFYDSSWCVPPRQLQVPMDTAMVDFDFEKGTYVEGDPEYCMRTAIMSAVQTGWGGKGPIPAHLYHKYYNLYNRHIKPLVRNADVYHILPRPDGIHWDGMEYYDPTARKGLVFVFKPTAQASPNLEIKLRGLDPDAQYQIAFEDGKGQEGLYTGTDLAESGLTVKTDAAAGQVSEMIWINR